MLRRHWDEQKGFLRQDKLGLLVTETVESVSKAVNFLVNKLTKVLFPTLDFPNNNILSEKRELSFLVL